MSIDMSEPRTALIALAAASPPADRMTRRLVDEHGPVRTLQFATSPIPPRGITPLGFATWRRMIAPALDETITEAILADSHRLGLTILTPDDDHWPTGMRDLRDHAPLLLWAKGDTSLLPRPVASPVTITGARASSSYGEHMTTEIVHDLGRDGVQIVSGGAYGIDHAAHQAALTTGGKTIAVMSSGLDRHYPIGNADLIERVAESGVLLSEAAPGVAPTKHRFEERGRILAALSAATVVVEAGARSGTRLVAEEAHVIRRSVGAIPGPITSATSTGCHLLIQEGIATLVTGAHDIRRLIDPTTFDTLTPERSTAAARLSALPGMERFGLAPGPIHDETPPLQR
ncbi:DNA-processing protein DprA [Microbacterium sp. NPDC056234]|uniref:DNA-processing protein DprA n=1 Tax=Microbacterium sp. NPDC056234 TaxID=3345757 RepID=UPI0035D775EB